ncbi:MAG TPA: HypC/HybG/HupF family hydrogenase formation chaperone [Thermopolyspora sp.]|jgi:hydrogenase assembly chaperone HypC/HupF
MCLAIPSELVGAVPGQPDLAVVEVSGVRRRINVALLEGEDLTPGDWLLVHVGFALSKISESEAQAVLAMLADMGQPYEDEIDALRQSNIS